MFYCDQKVYLYHAMHTLDTHSVLSVNNFPKIENNIWCCYSVGTIFCITSVNMLCDTKNYETLNLCRYLQYGGSR